MIAFLVSQATKKVFGGTRSGHD